MKCKFSELSGMLDHSSLHPTMNHDGCGVGATVRAGGEVPGGECMREAASCGARGRVAEGKRGGGGKGGGIPTREQRDR